MYGLGAAFLPGIVVGASIDLQENSNILRYMERERQFNPSIAFLTPTLCEMLLKGQRSPKAYKLAVTAGDRIKKDTFLTFESRFGRLLNLYGSTELGAIAASEPDDPIDVRAITVGKPMPGVQIRLNEGSSEFSDEMATVGELCCKHEYGFEGYVDENGNRIGRDITTQSDWFETGDLGRIRQNGYIEVLSRCDHSVNRSGLLVLFADIERAMEMIEGTERVVVVAKGESEWGQRIMAFCVPSKGVTLSGVQVRTACFDILPRYAIPDDVFIVSSLPTLPNGKVDRPALIEMASEGHHRRH
jgi:acyl-CoA synthetase (AMP-forming)/AMP-acid ligase II